MIKIHQPLLTVKPMLFYVAGEPTSFKSEFKSFLEDISDCLPYFYSSIFMFLLLFPHSWTMIFSWEWPQ